MTVDDDDVGRCQHCTCPDCMRPLVYFGGKVLCQRCDLTEQGPMSDLTINHDDRDDEEEEEEHLCPTCGGDLPVDRPAVLCPECVLSTTDCADDAWPAEDDACPDCDRPLRYFGDRVLCPACDLAE